MVTNVKHSTTKKGADGEQNSVSSQAENKNVAARSKTVSQDTCRRLMTFMLQGNKLKLLVVAFCVLLSALGFMAVSFSIKILIDRYITPLLASSSPNFTPLYLFLLSLAVVFIISTAADYVYQRIMLVIGMGVMRDIRKALFAHMQYLPVSYFDANPSGNIMSLYTNDVDSLNQLLIQSVPQIMKSLLTVIVTLISMLFLSPLLTAFVILMVFFMYFTSSFIGKRSGRLFRDRQLALADITGYIEEHFNGLRVIKVFNHEQEATEAFAALNAYMSEKQYKASALAQSMGPLMGNIGNLQFVATAIIGALMGVAGIGGITLGTLAAYLNFSRSFSQPFMQIAQQFNIIIMALAGAERIFTVIDLEHEKDEGKITLVLGKKDEQGVLTELNPLEHISQPVTNDIRTIWAWKEILADGQVKLTELRGDVRFNDLSFAYVEGQTVLHDITLYAKPGQKVAFVGSTGAGKTTITNLLNRFYDVPDGSITYDGIDINRISKYALRQSLGIVLQDTHLFTGTIRENIRYGNLQANDSDVYAAAKLAKADSFIRRLPQGYDTVISGEGEELSQGQRQLLAIARAAVAKTPVLILDEATSSIDTRTEKLVQQGMDNLMSGRTVFVIAHRLSTIRNSDVIIVLDHGRIIERGTHESLLTEKGIYYQLYTGDLEMD